MSDRDIIRHDSKAGGQRAKQAESDARKATGTGSYGYGARNKQVGQKPVKGHKDK